MSRATESATKRVRTEGDVVTTCHIIWSVEHLLGEILHYLNFEDHRHMLTVDKVIGSYISCKSDEILEKWKDLNTSLKFWMYYQKRPAFVQYFSVYLEWLLSYWGEIDVELKVFYIALIYACGVATPTSERLLTQYITFNNYRVMYTALGLCGKAFHADIPHLPIGILSPDDAYIHDEHRRESASYSSLSACDFFAYLYGAALGGHLEILQEFADPAYIMRYTKTRREILSAAIKGGHVAILKYLYTWFDPATIPKPKTNVFDFSSNGEFSYLTSGQMRVFFGELYEEALKYNQATVLDFFLEKGYLPRNYVVAAMENNNSKLVLSYISNPAFDEFDTLFESAAYTGDEQILRLCYEKGAKNVDAAMAQAAYGGHKNIVRICAEEWHATAFGAALTLAVKNSHQAIIDYIKQHHVYVVTDDCLQAAAEAGNESIVFQNCLDYETAMVLIPLAARHGHTDIVRYLYEYVIRVYPSTSAAERFCTIAGEALIDAATSGNIKTVDYLYHKIEHLLPGMICAYLEVMLMAATKPNQTEIFRKYYDIVWGQCGDYEQMHALNNKLMKVIVRSQNVELFHVYFPMSDNEGDLLRCAMQYKCYHMVYLLINSGRCDNINFDFTQLRMMTMLCAFYHRCREHRKRVLSEESTIGVE